METYLGEQVGYSTKFESDFNADKMWVKVVTDEVLVKEILVDPMLTKYEAILLAKRELWGEFFRKIKLYKRVNKF